MFFYIGIGLIKKASKNQIILEKDFYNLIKNGETSNNIDLNEDNDISISEKYNDKIINDNKFNSLNNELNYVKNLIHITDEKLLLYENNNNLYVDNNLNINNPENNKNIINSKEKISNKKLFSVVTIEKKFNDAKINNNQTKIVNFGERKNKKDNNNTNNKERDISFITSDIREKKELSQPDDDEDTNSFYNLNEFLGYYNDKNEINFENRIVLRKQSGASNYSIEENEKNLYAKEIYIN